MAQEPEIRLNKEFVAKHKTTLILLAVGVSFLICVAAISAQNASSVYIPSDQNEQQVDEQAESDDSSKDDVTDKEPEPTIWIHVSGAVVHEGLYELGESSRINDAIEAAGGLVDDATLADINLAQKLVDGQKVYVPHEGEVTQTQEGSDGSVSASNSATGLININTASQNELEQLSGIGPSTAEAIVKDREAHGAFASPEDIMRVSGIGPKKFEKIKDEICV